MEAALIDLLAEKSPIVVAGDDDQALYSQLRGASWDHIRARYVSGNYEIFELPFCMRCPEVIVGAVNDVIASAREKRKLDGRINKPYRYFEPIKGEDSRCYPKMELVETSIQRLNANYFGQYIEESIEAIPPEDRRLAEEKGEPVALIIGSNPYRRQVEDYLITAGLVQSGDKKEPSARELALEYISQNAASNLGWRIILSEGDQSVAEEMVRTAAEKNIPLVKLIPEELKEAVLAEVENWALSYKAAVGEASARRPNMFS
jgi:hypothetical protein